MDTFILSNGKLIEKEIENGLSTLQEIVEGYIETPFMCREFSDNDIVVVINEEGKLLEGLRPEIAIIDKNTNAIIDVIFGNCIVCGYNDEGDMVSLNDKQMKIIKEMLKPCVLITDENMEYIVHSIEI